MSFLTNEKQESGFQQVGGLVTRNISVFCLWRVALYFKVMPNSIDFYKGVFLHVIPVRIIVPWLKFMIGRYVARITFSFRLGNLIFLDFCSPCHQATGSKTPT